jgi:hypothetical protein
MSYSQDIADLTRVVARNTGRDEGTIEAHLRALADQGHNMGEALNTAFIAARNATPATPSRSGPEEDVRWTPNQYLEGSIPGGRTPDEGEHVPALIYGFGARGEGEPFLEMEQDQGMEIHLTRSQWEALKASVDASWPGRIEAGEH